MENPRFKPDFRPGDIVLSLRGRDRDRLLFVLSCRNALLELCDGRLRRTERPKQKKPKHVRRVARPDSAQCRDRPDTLIFPDSVVKTAEKLRLGTPVPNSELRRALRDFRECLPDDGFYVRRDADVKG